MKTIKGPGIFLAQFADNQAPFNSLEGMAHWAAQLGFVGVQIPIVGQAAVRSEACRREPGLLRGSARDSGRRQGLKLTELSTHLQGQLVASNPAYDVLLDGFAPAELAGRPKEQQAWAVQQLEWAAMASSRLGLTAHATFSGALAWPYFYPWPQRPAGLIDEAFEELGRRWTPILNRVR